MNQPIPSIDIDPTPKQLKYLQSITRYTCFSGGFGCGKTIAGCLRGLLISQLAPGNFGLIGRLTYPELRDTTRKTFFEICPHNWYDVKNGGVWLSSENYLRLYNGSEIIFRHLDTMSEKELLSLNLGWFFIDQAEEIQESTFSILISRLRKAEVSRRYGFLACNPIPHNWIWKRFKEKPSKDFELVEATTFENPYLPKDYIPSMLELYPPEMAKRYIYASWDAFEGQIFLEWDSKVHIIDDFEIPSNWERLIGIDHGLVCPTAALWAAIDNDGNCVAPETKILTSNLNWVKAGEVQAGDTLAGFDEKVPKSGKRRWKKSVVKSVKRVVKPSYRLTLSDGTTFVCSFDHQWLIETLGRRKQWRATEDLVDGWKMLRVSDVWDKDTSYGAGYLSAAFDGEGSLGINQGGTLRLSFVQRENKMLEVVKKELQKRSIKYGNYHRKSSDCVLLTINRKRDTLRFLGSVKPKRLFSKFDINLIKGFGAFAYPTIVKKEFIGETEVISIQSSTRTYVAEGIASHNCFIYDEHYEANQPVSYHATKIREKSEGQNISIVVIDPSTKARTREKKGFPWSVLEEYNDYKIYPVPANPDRRAGINRLREFMRIDPERRHPITGQKGSPKLFVFRSCQNLTSEIPRYQWKKLRSITPRNPPEEPVNIDDHALDALRYILMTKWPSTVEKPTGLPFVPEDAPSLGSQNEIAQPWSKDRNPDELLGDFYGE